MKGFGGIRGQLFHVPRKEHVYIEKPFLKITSRYKGIPPIVTRTG
jgi:hypothetical protein